MGRERAVRSIFGRAEAGKMGEKRECGASIKLRVAKTMKRQSESVIFARARRETHLGCKISGFIHLWKQSIEQQASMLSSHLMRASR